MPAKRTRKDAPKFGGDKRQLDDGKHARLAPSACKNYEICPSFIPSEESTKAGERGTYLHKVLEHKVAPEEVLDEQDTTHLLMIEDYVKPREQAAIRNKLKVLREHRFNLLKLGIDGCDRGTGDLLILDKPKRHIDLMDWKFGWWEVDDAEVNIQVGIYTLGAFFEFPWVETVGVHILQPARDEVSTHTFTRQDIEPILLRARTIADRVAKKAGIEFNPTVNNCLWCDNKAECKALQSFVLQVADQAKLQVPSGIDLSPSTFDNLKHAGDIYDLANVIERWCGSMKYHLTQLALNGLEVANHSIREVSGKRIFVDNEGAYDLLHDDFGVSLSEFLTGCNPSVTNILEVVSKKAPKGKMGAAAKTASAALLAAGVLSSTRPSAYLVRDKEKKIKDAL